MMARADFLAIEEYLPHSGRMVLLDRVNAANHDEITTETTIRANSPFQVNGEVGAWVGIEYMAQTIAALAGWEAHQSGQTVQVGFLVGTRQYHCTVHGFALGATLIIHARREFQADNGVAVMNCQICDTSGHTLAEAQISVFQPHDLQDYLQQ